MIRRWILQSVTNLLNIKFDIVHTGFKQLPSEKCAAKNDVCAAFLTVSKFVRGDPSSNMQEEMLRLCANSIPPLSVGANLSV